MAENTQEALTKLAQLSEIDVRYSRALSEKNKITEEIKRREAKLAELSKSLQAKEKDYQEKTSSYSQQEKFLKAEQEKLKDRRKSVSSINDYKTQGKAAKEIDFAVKQLFGMEEKMLASMEVFESLAKEVEAAKAAQASYEGELSTYKASVVEALENFQKTMSACEEERKAVSHNLDNRLLSAYRRISERYPGGALVPIKENSCGGCYFTLGPQIIVQASRGQQIVNCPSCGRILIIEKKAEVA